MSEPVGPAAPPNYVPFKDLIRDVMAEERCKESLSSVKITESAKQVPQIEVKCYDGVTEEEMQRLLDLAATTFETGKRRLNLAGNIRQA